MRTNTAVDLGNLPQALLQKLNQESDNPPKTITVTASSLQITGTRVECTTENPIDIAWRDRLQEKREGEIIALLKLLFDEDRPIVIQVTTIDGTAVRRVWNKK